MPVETKRARLNKLGAQLKNTRTSYEAHWRDLGEHFAPRRTRFYSEDKHRGDKRHGKIVNEHGLLAARTLRSGMFAGITSPARPWRRLTTPDPDLAEFGRVKQWLEHVNKNMRTLDQRSNLYSGLPIIFGDTGVFGTSAMAVFEDVEDGMRCTNFPIGSYWLALNERNVVDTFMHEFSMTVRQLVMKFGNPLASESNKWANFSLAVRNAWDQGMYETEIRVTHLIHPNMEYDPNRLDPKFKKYSSCYFESAGSITGNAQVGYKGADGPDQTFLRESGLDLFRILAPRWETTEGDAYGVNCPGMEALGSTREIQVTEKRKSQAIEKMLHPPLKGPAALRNQKVSLLAGDLTLVDEREGKNGLSPIHEVRVPIAEVIQDLETKQQRISRAFYEDLFLMITNMQGIQPRNEREIAERQEEKLLALGPVLECMNDELLDPLTDIQFEIMRNLGMVPEPPEEISGMELKVEYESVMAKAQKLVGVAGTERFFGFTGNLLAAFPEVRDRVNADEALQEYGDMMGVSAKILRTDEDVQQIQQDRAQKEQQQKIAAAVPELAKAAESLSAADLSTDNVLSRMLAGA